MAPFVPALPTALVSSVVYHKIGPLPPDNENASDIIWHTVITFYPLLLNIVSIDILYFNLATCIMLPLPLSFSGLQS
jgi:hypothetical protein